MTHRTLALLLVVLGLPTGVAAAPSQDLDAVRKAVADFARSQTTKLPGEVEIEVPPLDDRLQLSACRALQTYLPAGTRPWGRSSVGVRCQKPESWSIVVPVTVKVMAEALYAARPLARGEPLTDQDVTSQRTDLTQLPAGVLTDRNQAVGRIPNLSVTAGLPLRADMLHGAPCGDPGTERAHRVHGRRLQGEFRRPCARQCGAGRNRAGAIGLRQGGQRSSERSRRGRGKVTSVRDMSPLSAMALLSFRSLKCRGFLALVVH